MAKTKMDANTTTRGAIMLIAGIVVLLWDKALQTTLGLALIILGILALAKK